MLHWSQNGFSTPSLQGRALDKMFGHCMSDYDAVCYDGKSITMYEYGDVDHTYGQTVVWSEKCDGDEELYRQLDDYLSSEHGNW